MRKINQDARKTLDNLTEGLVKVGDHRKIENSPYMPLSIEVIGHFGRDEGLEISVCHYGEQNGDLMRDPEMIFIKPREGNYYPYYFRNDYLGIEQYSAEFAPDGSGIESYKPRLQRQHAIFAGQWAANLREQGFIEALQDTNTWNKKCFPVEDPDSMMEQRELCYYDAPKKSLIEGSAAYNFARAEGLI